MAKFGRNHTPQGSKGNTAARVGLFAAVITGLIAVFNWFSKSPVNLPNEETKTEEVVTPVDEVDDQEFYLPTSSTGAIEATVPEDATDVLKTNTSIFNLF